MNLEKILSIIEFVQNETPENQELLDKAIGAIKDVLQSEQALVDENAMNLLRERDYDKMQKYIDMSKTIASVQSSIKDIFEEFLEDKFMQGKTRKYFSRNEASLRNPEKIKESNIFVETNLSANSIRDMVMKSK